MSPKRDSFQDDQLGPLLSIVVAILALAVLYLVILLPFSGNAGAIGGALVAITTLIGGLVGARTLRKNRDSNGRKPDDE